MNQFEAQDMGSFRRKVGTRDKRISAGDPYKIVFSFKYYLPNTLKKNRQSFQTWEKNKFLSKLSDTFKSLSELTMTEAKQNKMITEYGSFPSNSKFTCPKSLRDSERWGVIKNIYGKARVAGIISDNIFYIVFLDKDHDFWPVEKKHT
jgi:hypothetical protein